VVTPVEVLVREKVNTLFDESSLLMINPPDNSVDVAGSTEANSTNDNVKGHDEMVTSSP
jgi:hypothetical protein